MSEIQVHGFCDERFASVRTAFEKNLRLDLELGATFALAIEGKFLVDLWAGYADRARTKPWQEHHIVNVSSSSKIPVALCGLMILDRGLIELSAPVSRYWPEFAAAGKSELPVKYLFCHAAGLAGFDPPIPLEKFIDWQVAVSNVAAQKPWWEPGTASGYHAMTFNLLIGELVRRTTGMTIGKFLQDEVADKVGADFFLGLPKSKFDSLAEIDYGQKREMDTSSFAYRVSQGSFLGGNFLDVQEQPLYLKAEQNGFGNARSLVKIGSILANEGSLYGHEFLSKETVRLSRQEHMYTHDPYFNAPVRYGLGFGLASKEFPLPFPNASHWGGAGGSIIVMEPDSKASWSYVPTRFDPAIASDARGNRLSRAAIAGLQNLN